MAKRGEKKGGGEEGPAPTMLPAWSRKATPLVFISLRYGLLNVFILKPMVCSQGSDMSLRTIWPHKSG